MSSWYRHTPPPAPHRGRRRYMAHDFWQVPPADEASERATGLAVLVILAAMLGSWLLLAVVVHVAAAWL